MRYHVEKVTTQGVVFSQTFNTLKEARACADRIADRRWVSPRERAQTSIIDTETWTLAASY